MSTKTEKLAAAFCRALHEELGEKTMAEVIRRNRAPRYAGCCASHDFCDANMTMMHAWSTISNGREPRIPFSDRTLRIINAAWELAKESAFTFREDSAKRSEPSREDLTASLCEVSRLLGQALDTIDARGSIDMGKARAALVRAARLVIP
jgi:hypothetical protein